MSEEQQKVLYDLFGVLMSNEKKESEAVEGYNQQLKIIDEVRDKCAGMDDYEKLSPFLDELELATKEKISDELNHVQSLYEEYIKITGIQPAKD